MTGCPTVRTPPSLLLLLPFMLSRVALLLLSDLSLVGMLLCVRDCCCCCCCSWLVLSTEAKVSWGLHSAMLCRCRCHTEGTACAWHCRCSLGGLASPYRFSSALGAEVTRLFALPERRSERREFWNGTLENVAWWE